jgi:hypothetical protein
MTNVKLNNAPDAFAWPIATAFDDSALRALVRATLREESVMASDDRWVRPCGETACEPLRGSVLTALVCGAFS